MPMTELQEWRLDRAVGAIVGAACGDGLGAALEFTGPRRDDGSDWIRDMVGGGAFGWKAGETTDDTAMMRCVLEMYLESDGRYDQASLVRKFLAWYASGPKDVGSWTSFALSTWRNAGVPGELDGLKRGSTNCYKPRYRERNPVLKVWQESSSRGHASNGGVMRCIPTALVHSPSMRNTLFEAAAICEDTHPDPRCVASCQAVVWMASKLIRDLESPAGRMRGHKKGSYSMHEVWVDVMKVVLDLGVPELYQGLLTAADLPWGAWTNSGSSIGTTVSAFACLLQAKNFEDGLLAVVNRGGDADTVGAVAGGMLGARFGYSAIPKRWKDSLVGHEELRAMAIELWLKRRQH